MLKTSLTQSKAPIMIKFLERSGIQVTKLNIIKVIFSKLLDNVKLNGGKPQKIPVKLTKIQDCPLSLCLLNIILEFTTKAIRQINEVKEIKIQKEEVKKHYL